VTSAARAALFLVFVALSIIASLTARDEVKRRRTQRFIVLAVLASLAAGLTGREAWPFSAWPMDNALMPGNFQYLMPVVADAQGKEYPVDPRAFEPVSWIDLSTWFAARSASDSVAVRETGPWLLRVLRGARARAARHDDVGRFRRRLGIFAAPHTFISPVRWSEAGTFPDSIAELRLYEFRVDLDRSATGTSATRRLAWTIRDPR
jgi:hypothetical protein